MAYSNYSSLSNHSTVATNMVMYKNGNLMHHDTNAAFDETHSPGTAAPNAGIYRCTACGDEIGIAKDHTLPPQNHRQHAAGIGKIEWQLVAYAVQQP